MISERAIHFQGVANFRDFGGFSGRFGAVSTGLLLRSGHLAAATDPDLETLGGLALAAIVDLRRPSERAQAPNRFPPGFAGEVVACDAGDRRDSPHIEFLRQGDLSDDAVERYLIGYYREAFFEPRHREMFARSLALIPSLAGPMLVHCTAGKDRTGLLAALIQRVLGAHPDDVLADYLATNAQVSPERLAEGRRALAGLIGQDPSEAVLRGYLGVEARHLDAAFQELDRVCGGLDAYLQGLGVDAEAQDRVRRRMVR